MPKGEGKMDAVSVLRDTISTSSHFLLDGFMKDVLKYSIMEVKMKNTV